VEPLWEIIFPYLIGVIMAQAKLSNQPVALHWKVFSPCTVTRRILMELDVGEFYVLLGNSD
jgi:hypothetical protein